MWKQATSLEPLKYIRPVDHGWKKEGNLCAIVVDRRQMPMSKSVAQDDVDEDLY